MFPDSFPHQVPGQIGFQADVAERLHLDMPDETLLMRIDSHVLRNVISELVTNALKFSEGAVHIRLEPITDGIQCQVQDSGSGIPEAEMAHIFEPFFRGRSAENIRGTGLGLAVAYDYIELVNGTIDVVSEPGNTIFTATFYQSKL